MRFRIDQNLHEEVAGLLRRNGHDAVSVYDQRMQGRPDEDVAAVCRREGRVIVTQDLDFSNIIAFPTRAARHRPDHLRRAQMIAAAMLAIIDRTLITSRIESVRLAARTRSSKSIFMSAPRTRAFFVAFRIEFIRSQILKKPAYAQCCIPASNQHQIRANASPSLPPTPLVDLLPSPPRRARQIRGDHGRAGD
jgi:hypothetical protein